jgi:hypothetical protein
LHEAEVALGVQLLFDLVLEQADGFGEHEVGPQLLGIERLDAIGTGPQDAGRRVRTVQMFVRSDAAQLAGLVARVDAGDLQIEVAGRRPLTDLAAVHDQATAGPLAGNTVLTP